MKLPKISFKKSVHNKHLSEPFLALDITDYSVKSVFFSENSNPPLVVNGVSVAHSFNTKLRAESISSTINECFEQAGSKTYEAIVGLSGSNVFGFIIMVKIIRETANKAITEKETQKIYEKVKNVAYDQVKKKWSNLYAFDSEFEPLDMVVTENFIDEKNVSKLVGATGEIIKLSVYCSYAVKSYYDWLIKILEKIKFTSLTVTTTLYSQSKILAEEDKNFILADIGESHTDIAIVLGKNIIRTCSFDLGGGYFSDYIANKLNIERRIAVGKKEAFSSGSVSEEDEKLGDILYLAGRDWVSAFSGALSSMTSIKSFPKMIYLSGGGANLKLLEELLYEKPWRKDLNFSGDLDVKVVSSSSWEKHIKDNIGVLKGASMFPPASVGLVRLELE